MNVPIKWLKEYVDIKVDSKEIADRLTMTGSKVEYVNKFGVKVSNVVLGKIESIENHPNSDKLRIFKVNIGKSLITVVGNIPNLEAGMIVPVAKDGAILANGNKIEKGEVKGVVSEGMIVPVFELGLNKKQLPGAEDNGLYVLDNNTELGKDICEILNLGEEVIEFEITPNRPDCLSIIGMAREYAATFDVPCNDITSKYLNNKNVVSAIDKFSVKIESDKCFRYTAKVVENVIIGQSPNWLKERLVLSGIRPINNIVDITNYIMLELGQPMHAFDSNLIESNKIIVRNAKNKEEIITLDGETKVLDENDLVICDSNKPVAVAGIMGGEHSGINENTKKVILESACFNRGSIRLTSKKIGLRTDSSSRFEKGLPQDLTMIAINRACDLITELNIGKVREEVIDIYPKKQEIRNISLDFNKINKYLGTNISEIDIIKILNKIGIIVNGNEAIIPYYRQDIENFVDICEEVARFYGYDKLPSNLMVTETTIGMLTKDQIADKKIKNICQTQGFSEVLTYTFYNNNILDKFNIDKKSELRDSIKISNPLNEEYVDMRTTMIPAIINILQNNYSKNNDNVKVFELGRVYIKNNEGNMPTEKNICILGAYGKNFDYYNLKGAVESILDGFKLEGYIYERLHASKSYHPGQSAKINIEGRNIVNLGMIHPEVLKNFNLPNEVFVAEIDMDVLKELFDDQIKYEPITKYPSTSRDLAFVIKDEVLAQDIESCIKEHSNKIVESIQIFDVYKGNQIENGYKSMAYSIVFRDKTKTLQEKEINEVLSDIIEALENKFNISIRK